jgi:hypothetical protein
MQRIRGFNARRPGWKRTKAEERSLTSDSRFIEATEPTKKNGEEGMVSVNIS